MFRNIRAVHTILFGVLVILWFGLYLFADRLGDMSSGLIICSNDCTDFNNLSDHLLREGRFAPIGGDYHTTPFYWLYISLVAAIKAVFGNSWHVAYAAIMVVLLYGFVAMASRGWVTPTVTSRAMLVSTFAAVATNLWLLTYGRTLLTDYGFALAAILLFLGAARARAREAHGAIVLTLALAIALCFFRPNGIFVLCLVSAVAVTAWRPLRNKMWLALAVPPLIGLAAWVFSAGMTVYAVQHLEAVQNGTATMAGSFGQFLEFNYTGDDDLTHANRLGALLTNAPYKSWYMNDGNFLGIFASFLLRLPKVVEILMPNFSGANNIIRLVYYSALYIGVLGFVISVLLGRDPDRYERALFAALVFSYLLIFVAMSHVTLRFRLVFDVGFAVMAAHFYAAFLGRRLSQIKMGRA
jgi:hypothetical protein